MTTLSNQTDTHTKAKLFRGLADGSRLAVLQSLRHDPRCVSEIVDLTGLSQSNVSSHLACMRDCGLVEREARGRFAYYSIANDDVRAILDAAETVLARVGEFVDQCENYEAVTRKGLR